LPSCRTLTYRDGRAGLLGEIKQRHPELPVLMVTAYGDDDRRRRATGLGTAKVLTKPVDFDVLKLQLRQLPNAAD
jgi:DNA-binding NtrC family response regulator